MIRNLKNKYILALLLSTSATAVIADNASCCAAATTGCCSQDVSGCCSGCTQSQNLWQPHAFSVSMSREVMLEKSAWAINDDLEGWHGTFGIGFEYMKTLRACPTKCCSTLGSMPFWAPNKSNTMSIGDNSGNYDVDAYQLGLGPVTTHGFFKINPVVYQTGADILLYIGAHRSERGFFIKAHGPVGIIGVNPRLDQDENLKSVEYNAYDLSNTTTTAIPAPYENVKEAFAGGEAAGDLRSLKFGKIWCNRTSSAKFGDLAAAIGYNFFADERKHFGLAIRFSAPTGNKAEGVYVLEPIFGRNGHWGAGGELFTHWRVLQSKNADKYLDIWFDGTAEHLSRSSHARSFDLRENGMGSKYLLIANYANGTYQNEINNAINLTTLPVNSTFGVEGNFAFMLDYHHSNISIGIGYEGWGRTCEQLSIDCACPGAFNLNNYAVLGRQTVQQEGDPAKGLCDPTATIGKSLAVGSTSAKDATVAANRISSDMSDALDINGQRAHAAYTSKLFVQIEYTSKESDYCPYVALTGGAEISHLQNSAANFWSIGLQGGLAF